MSVQNKCFYSCLPPRRCTIKKRSLVGTRYLLHLKLRTSVAKAMACSVGGSVAYGWRWRLGWCSGGPSANGSLLRGPESGRGPA